MRRALPNLRLAYARCAIRSVSVILVTFCMDVDSRCVKLGEHIYIPTLSNTKFRVQISICTKKLGLRRMGLIHLRHHTNSGESNFNRMSFSVFDFQHNYSHHLVCLLRKPVISAYGSSYVLSVAKIAQ